MIFLAKVFGRRSSIVSGAANGRRFRNVLCPNCGYSDGKRSHEAHGLLRLWNRILAKHFGLSEEGMLSTFFERNDLMVDEANPFTGELRKQRISTKDLTKLAAAAVMRDMESVALEYMGAPLPYHQRERMRV